MDIGEFKNCLIKGHPVLGLDIGSKTIGVAASDAGWFIATPLETIFRTSFINDMAKLKSLIESRKACALIAGLPLEMSGAEGERAKITRMIGDRISLAVNLPIYYFDERFSSLAIERIMIEQADLSRSKRKQVIDRGAAAYILQGFLDSMNNDNKS